MTPEDAARLALRVTRDTEPHARHAKAVGGGEGETMTPEQFEAKWGEALRACGADPDEIMGNCGGEYAEDTARGLLVAWAAEREAWVDYACRSDGENHPHDEMPPTGAFRFRRVVGYAETDYPGVSISAQYLTFDAALIAGCIALAKQEAAK